jgi:hypothetical protein
MICPRTRTPTILLLITGILGLFIARQKRLSNDIDYRIRG